MADVRDQISPDEILRMQESTRQSQAFFLGRLIEYIRLAALPQAFLRDNPEVRQFVEGFKEQEWRVVAASLEVSL